MPPPVKAPGGGPGFVPPQPKAPGSFQGPPAMKGPPGKGPLPPGVRPLPPGERPLPPSSSGASPVNLNSSFTAPQPRSGSPPMTKVPPPKTMMNPNNMNASYSGAPQPRTASAAGGGGGGGGGGGHPPPPPPPAGGPPSRSGSTSPPLANTVGSGGSFTPPRPKMPPAAGGASGGGGGGGGGSPPRTGSPPMAATMSGGMPAAAQPPTSSMMGVKQQPPMPPNPTSSSAGGPQPPPSSSSSLPGSNRFGGAQPQPQSTSSSAAVASSPTVSASPLAASQSLTMSTSMSSPPKVPTGGPPPSATLGRTPSGKFVPGQKAPPPAVPKVKPTNSPRADSAGPSPPAARASSPSAGGSLMMGANSSSNDNNNNNMMMTSTSSAAVAPPPPTTAATSSAPSLGSAPSMSQTFSGAQHNASQQQQQQQQKSSTPSAPAPAPSTSGSSSAPTNPPMRNTSPPLSNSSFAATMGSNSALPPPSPSPSSGGGGGPPLPVRSGSISPTGAPRPKGPPPKPGVGGPRAASPPIMELGASGVFNNNNNNNNNNNVMSRTTTTTTSTRSTNKTQPPTTTSAAVPVVAAMPIGGGAPKPPTALPPTSGANSPKKMMMPGGPALPKTLPRAGSQTPTGTNTPRASADGGFGGGPASPARLESLSPVHSPINFTAMSPNANNRDASPSRPGPVPLGGGGGKGGMVAAPVRNPPAKKRPEDLQPHHLGQRSGSPGGKGVVPMGKAPTSNPANAAARSSSTASTAAALGAAAASSPSSTFTGNQNFSVISGNAARLNVPASTLSQTQTGGRVPLPQSPAAGQQQTMMAAATAARPISLAVSSDDEDEDDAFGGVVTATRLINQHGDSSSSQQQQQNRSTSSASLRRAVVIVRPAQTAPTVPLWVQHVMSSAQAQQQAMAVSPHARGIVSPIRGLDASVADASAMQSFNSSGAGNNTSGSGSAAAHHVKSFVLHHFGKRTQGLLHDLFRCLVDIAQTVDGSAATGHTVMTYCASVCYTSMALRLHDRRFALQHALLLSFANTSTGGISPDAHRPLAAIDVEAWVNTLTAVLDSTRSSTCSFAAALLEEDLGVPNYVAHARAAGRHDAYLELTLPEVLARLKALAATPWLRIVFACCSPDVLTSLSQRHATVAALFERFGAPPTVFSQQHGVMSPNPHSNKHHQQHHHQNPSATEPWAMTTARSRASATLLPQEAFPVPHMLSSTAQLRKMLECSGTSDSVNIMPQILTMSGFKQLVEVLSHDAPGVAMNFAEFQMFLAVVADRCCKFEDASSFDSGINPPPPGSNQRPLVKAIAGKIHHIVQYLAS